MTIHTPMNRSRYICLTLDFASAILFPGVNSRGELVRSHGASRRRLGDNFIIVLKMYYILLYYFVIQSSETKTLPAQLYCHYLTKNWWGKIIVHSVKGSEFCFTLGTGHKVCVLAGWRVFQNSTIKFGTPQKHRKIFNTPLKGDEMFRNPPPPRNQPITLSPKT
jgi:hypothetical protein